jgi:chemotaxis protein CheX
MAPGTVMNIASTMMGGMTIVELDDMARSAMCEFVNMCVGVCLTSFQDLEVDITPPTMVMGEKMILMLGLDKVLLTHIATPWGDLELRLGMEQ